MYAEATNVETGTIATLQLPILTTPPTVSALCLTFWWSMFGEHIGTLNVTQKTAEGVQTIWSLNGNQGCKDLFTSSLYKIYNKTFTSFLKL